MAKKDFAAMEGRLPSGDSAARAALRSRMAHPTSVRLGEVQPNPLNPRYDDDDPEVRDLAETLKRVGQLQPALVVSREQYLQAYPSERISLGSEPWVVIVGNRRLAAARLAGRAALDVKVAADLASVEDFEDRILIENIQRKDLPPLLEAAHLQRRLDRPGQSLRSIAEAIGKSHVYVKQRLDLLSMIPEFQELFRSGAITLKVARQLGVLSEVEQRATLAAGPPFTPERKAKAGEEGSRRVNPVNTQPRVEPGNPTASTAADQTASGGDTDGEQGAPPADPRSSAGDYDRDVPAMEEHPNPNGYPDPAGGSDDLHATRTSVVQCLDSALAELDRALPAGGNGVVGQALTEARRHIEHAQAALHRATTATGN